jgi:hypothetical protein
MSAVDMFWMALTLAGAGYLFYRSFWKQKGTCSGCDQSNCHKK